MRRLSSMVTPGHVTRGACAALVLAALALSLACTRSAPALPTYVNADDGAYRWEKVAQTALNDEMVGYDLTLVSQEWRGAAWRHALRIVTPREIQRSPTLVLMVIAGSGGGDEELTYGAMIAAAVGAPVATLHDVPNQPLLGGLREDGLIAETFVRYMETGDETWPLLLPMVKSAVKGMDAIEEFVETELGVPVSGFVVTGGSKRGWTAWLTAAVDVRVKAIVPMAYDNLDLRQQMKHQLEVWGAYSEEISDYTDRGIPQRLASGEKAAQELAGIVDPFAYRDEITVPKLIITGTNDRYWPLDAANLYYDQLVGEKYMSYVHDAGHGLGGGITYAIADLVAFFLKTDGRIDFPNLQCESRMANGRVHVTVRSDRAPSDVRVWVARSKTRDFREARWEGSEMGEEDRAYTYTIELIPGEYMAFFAEAAYLEDGTRFHLSTTVSVHR